MKITVSCSPYCECINSVGNNVYVTAMTIPSYLVMMLDAHADSVDENSDHNAPAEVLALHNAPEFPSHIIPNVFKMSKTGLLPLFTFTFHLTVLLLARLFYCIFLIFLPVRRVAHSPCPFFQCTYRTVLKILRDSQTDGVGHGLRAVVLLALVRTVGC